MGSPNPRFRPRIRDSGGYFINEGIEQRGTWLRPMVERRPQRPITLGSGESCYMRQVNIVCGTNYPLSSDILMP